MTSSLCSHQMWLLWERNEKKKVFEKKYQYRLVVYWLAIQSNFSQVLPLLSRAVLLYWLKWPNNAVPFDRQYIPSSAYNFRTIFDIWRDTGCLLCKVWDISGHHHINEKTFLREVVHLHALQTWDYLPSHPFFFSFSFHPVQFCLPVCSGLKSFLLPVFHQKA